MSNTYKVIEVIECPECGDEHLIFGFDEPGEFPCSCGFWLNWEPKGRDWDAEIKDRKLDA